MMRQQIKIVHLKNNTSKKVFFDKRHYYYDNYNKKVYIEVSILKPFYKKGLDDEM